MIKLLRWVLPSFVQRWLGYDSFERIGAEPPRPLPNNVLEWSVADFYAADWGDKLNEAKRKQAVA